jgi:hypothetical protein
MNKEEQTSIQSTLTEAQKTIDDLAADGFFLTETIQLGGNEVLLVFRKI